MRISDWSSDVCSSDLGGDGEQIGCRGALGEAAQIRGLNRRAVGHRIGEGHPKLDHIGTPRDERVEVRGGVAVTAGDEGAERGAFVEGRCATGHCARPCNSKRPIAMSSRTEERRVGQEGVSKWGSWWVPYL